MKTKHTRIMDTARPWTKQNETNKTKRKRKRKLQLQRQRRLPISKGEENEAGFSSGMDMNDWKF